MTNPPPPSSPPSTFLIALFPGFQLLDLAGPLDILNILSLPPFNAGISMKFIAESMNPVPVKPIPPRHANWVFDVPAAMNQPSVNTAFNQYLQPDMSFDEYLAEAAADGDSGVTKKSTVLLIPGGVGARLHRIPAPSDGDAASQSASSEAADVGDENQRQLNVSGLVSFIKAAAMTSPSVQNPISTIITVCTGSDILARTGLLDHRRATSNMMRFKETAARHPAVDWQTAARWVKSPANNTRSSLSSSEDNHHLEIWSSAGISAGMDVTLAFVAEYFGGMQVARDIALRLEYDWREVGEGQKDTLYERFYGSS